MRHPLRSNRNAIPVGHLELSPNEFSLADFHAFERDLPRLHPGNRHVRDKIRQQLQILRDMHFVEFLGGGFYRLT
jgi:type II restriction enzyme